MDSVRQFQFLNMASVWLEILEKVVIKVQNKQQMTEDTGISWETPSPPRKSEKIVDFKEAFKFPLNMFSLCL